MDVKEQIQKLIQEAHLYRSQGLLRESRDKYGKLVDFIKKNRQIKNRENLISGVQRKIEAVEADIEKLIKAPATVVIPEKIQDIIKNKFALSAKDEDSAAIEGAVALAKFGQFERAIKEFDLLLAKESVRLAAAKNIIRCYVSNAAFESAVKEYEKWSAGNRFKPEELNIVRTFLQNILTKRGISKTLPPVAVQFAAAAAPGDGETPEEEFLDISAIKIILENGPQKGRAIEFDVNFQSGNVLSLIISSKDKNLIENLDVGVKLNHMQFFSPIAIFEGAGIVAEKTQIGTGPKRGDYSMDIKIVSTS